MHLPFPPQIARPGRRPARRCRCRHGSARYPSSRNTAPSPHLPVPSGATLAERPPIASPPRRPCRERAPPPRPQAFSTRHRLLALARRDDHAITAAPRPAHRRHCPSAGARPPAPNVAALAALGLPARRGTSSKLQRHAPRLRTKLQRPRCESTAERLAAARKLCTRRGPNSCPIGPTSSHDYRRQSPGVASAQNAFGKPARLRMPLAV